MLSFFFTVPKQFRDSMSHQKVDDISRDTQNADKH